MKDSYSLDADWEGLDQAVPAHYQAYFNIFQRLRSAGVAVKIGCGDDGRTAGGMNSCILRDRRRYPDGVPENAGSLPTPGGEIPQATFPHRSCPRDGEESRHLNVRRSMNCRISWVCRMKGLQRRCSWLQKPTKDRISWSALSSRWCVGDMEVNETKLANVVKGAHCDRLPKRKSGRQALCRERLAGR